MKDAKARTPLEAVLYDAVNPALRLLPPKMTSDDARVMLLATTLQEADAIYRIQIGGGPGHGLWQFEEDGAVKGVMHHSRSRDFARAICYTRAVHFDLHAVWYALPQDDILAAAFARLLLWTDYYHLPTLDSPVEEGWEMYLRCWRPGKPRPQKWPACVAQARNQVLPPVNPL